MIPQSVAQPPQIIRRPPQTVDLQPGGLRAGIGVGGEGQIQGLAHHPLVVGEQPSRACLYLCQISFGQPQLPQPDVQPVKFRTHPATIPGGLSANGSRLATGRHRTVGALLDLHGIAEDLKQLPDLGWAFEKNRRRPTTAADGLAQDAAPQTAAGPLGPGGRTGYGHGSSWSARLDHGPSANASAVAVSPITGTPADNRACSSSVRLAPFQAGTPPLGMGQTG
ncbi:hypothetical protein [Streptomyces sp. NPDC094149]|uniref:hypothetical protein n=1 Tax=Streptomyces sp. NPDC094149 TaxID=3155079 RepID=UPI0033315F13